MSLNVDFAFEGFRIVRQRPQVILFWGILLLIGNGIAMYAFTQLSGNAFADLQNVARSPSPDPSAMLAIYRRLGPGYAVLLPISAVLQAVISCAVFRNVLYDKVGGFGGVAFGGDELRQIGAVVLFFLLAIGIYIACLLAGMLVGVVLAIILGVIAKPLAALGVAIGIAAVIVALCFILLRLSLFAVQSFDQKKINLFGSWNLTQKSWGTLLGGYLIAFIMAMLVWGLCMAVFSFIVISLFKGNFSAMSPVFGGAVLSADAFSNPVIVGYMAVMYLIIQPMLIAIMTGASAAAYKQLRGMTTSVEKVF